VVVILAHEGLDAPQDRSVLVAEAVRDLALQPQGEDVPRALLLVMQFRADAQQLVVRAVELLALGGGQHAGLDEVLHGAEAALHPAEPDQVLVIAQAAAAALDVRFLQEDGVARLGVAVGLVGHAPLEEFLLVAVHAAAGEDFLELGEEGLIAAEEARLQQRGFRAQIGVGLRDQLGQRARGVAHLEADVPQDIEHVLDDVVDLRGELRVVVRMQEEDVDVAVGIELAAPEAAHGQQRDARRVVQVRLAMGLPGAGPDVAQHDGDHVRPALAQIASAAAALVLQLDPVLLELEEAAVDVEEVGRAQVRLVDQVALQVAQDLLEISRHSVEKRKRARESIQWVSGRRGMRLRPRHRHPYYRRFPPND
jgi:hypothetical protein